MSIEESKDESKVDMTQVGVDSLNSWSNFGGVMESSQEFTEIDNKTLEKSTVAKSSANDDLPEEKLEYIDDSTYLKVLSTSPLERFRDIIYAKLSSTVAITVEDSLVQHGLRAINLDGKSCGYRLSDQDIIHIAEALQSSDIPLQQLALRNHRITEKGVERIGSTLITGRGPASLSYLDLEGNDIKSIDGLNLQSNTQCDLVDLIISSNPLGEDGGLELASGLLHNRRLKSLIANNCHFNLKAMIGILTSLLGNDKIEVLHLDRPLLITTKKEECANHLSRLLLEKRSVVTSISLRNNDLHDYAIRLLSDSFSRHRYVKDLNLESNSITIGGAEALSSFIILQQRQLEAGTSNAINKFETLKLSYNIICDEGAIAIAEAIEVSSSLKLVTVKNNKIKSEGLMALGEALKKSTSLKSISLFGNEFDQRSGELFYDLTRNTLPAKGIHIDIDVYIVDGIYMIAEIN